MAIVVVFNLEVRQYNTVNAFANTNLLIEIDTKYTKGYKEEGKIL